MADRRHRTSSVPDFSTYPEEPRNAAPNISATERAYALQGGPLEPQERGVGERAKEAVSAATGKVRDIASRVKSKAGSTYQRASGKSIDVAQQQLDALRTRARDLRGRARVTANEKPVHMIVAAGIAGLLLGAGVRYWRGRA